MSGNPLHLFSASDSGILDALGGLTPKSQAQGRRPVTRDLGELRLDGAGLCSGPHESDDLGPAEGNLTNAAIDRQLRSVSLPADFLKRMHQAVE